MKAMTIHSMNELFLHGLQDIYYAENQITKVLQEMMNQRIDAALFDNLEHHLEETQEQIKRLEQIFRALGQTPQGVTCQAILGLIEEGQELVREIEDETVRDAAMLASAQAIERYEITRYGTLVAWADQIGRGGVVDQQQLGSLEIVDLLQLSLDEEKNQDARMTALAESRINRHAAA
jgi:ferritin-like metal-binding protein YciE